MSKTFKSNQTRVPVIHAHKLRRLSRGQHRELARMESSALAPIVQVVVATSGATVRKATVVK